MRDYEKDVSIVSEGPSWRSPKTSIKTWEYRFRAIGYRFSLHFVSISLFSVKRLNKYLDILLKLLQIA